MTSRRRDARFLTDAPTTALIATALFSSMPCQAQRAPDSPGPKLANPSDGRPFGGRDGVDESSTGDIIVTAQKKSERLYDTPQSISLLSQQSLRANGATQFRDFADTVPGLSFQSAGAGNTIVTLRGVTAGFDIGPLVGIYIDDVPYGSSSGFAKGSSLAFDSGLFNIERVEVLRGPQGTLYGASSMGGLIKYVTTPPDFAGAKGEAQFGVGTIHRGGTSFDGAANLNVPLSNDTIALRASGFYSRNGGYIDDIPLGRRDIDRSAVYGGRLDLAIKPTEDLFVRLFSYLQNIDRSGKSVADFRFDGKPATSSLETRRIVDEPFKQAFRLVGATIDYHAGSALITSVTSYQHVKSDFINDTSTTFVPIINSLGLPTVYSAAALYQRQRTNKFTQELRGSLTLQEHLTAVIGGFYTHEASLNEQGFGPLRDIAGNDVANNLLTFSAPSTYSEIAAFGNATYQFSSKFDVTGGIRLSTNRQSYTQFGSGLFIGFNPKAKSKDTVTTYLANARYRPTSNTMLYARFATGYRPGGPNFVVADPATGQPIAPPTFEPDTVKSYEVGLKTQSRDQVIALDVSGYHIDWDNIQVGAVRGGLGVFANAASAKIDGFEGALTVRPALGLTIASNVAYQHARLGADAPDIGGVKGERLPNVPRWSASVSTDYLFSQDGLKPRLGGTFRYVAARMASYDQSSSPPQYRLPAYIQLDLRAGIALKAFDLQLYVRNVTDERAQLSSLLSPPVEPAYIAILQPRTIGLTATTRF